MWDEISSVAFAVWLASDASDYVTGATYNAPGLLTASTYGQSGSFTGILNTFSYNTAYSR